MGATQLDVEIDPEDPRLDPKDLAHPVSLYNQLERRRLIILLVGLFGMLVSGLLFLPDTVLVGPHGQPTAVGWTASAGFALGIVCLAYQLWAVARLVDRVYDYAKTWGEELATRIVLERIRPVETWERRLDELTRAREAQIASRLSFRQGITIAIISSIVSVLLTVLVTWLIH